jgi:NAD(P)-dependent dehydrogenase (short-subunit alcohol dehydrogenase family)
MNKVVLITGISTGLGKATASKLVKDGHKVYGTIRTEGETDDHINTVMMDLTDPDSIKRAVDTVIEKEGQIDVLINNAGMHTGGPVETAPMEHIELQMDTNFLGMVRITRNVLPVMRNNDGGMIINISSIGGLMGLPFQAFYSASKFAIEGFSEVLRSEVKQFNIRVVVINPGDFHTNNTVNRRKYLAPTGPEDPYFQQYNKTLQKIEKDETGGWDPEILAGKISRIVGSKKPRQRYIIGSFEQRLSVSLNNIMAGSLFRKIIDDYYKIK